MLPFNSAELFLPQATQGAYRARTHPNGEVLSDMYRLLTLVPGPSDKHQAEAILEFFGITPECLSGDHGRERFWELVSGIRQQVFQQMLLATGEEYRVDWSRQDQSFCLWYRHRDTRREATRDLAFVRQHTLANLSGAGIREGGIHGFGLFATEDLPPNHCLGSLDGQEIHYDTYERLHYQLGQGLGRLRTYFFMEWNAISENMLLARPFRTYYSYINHNRNPNLKLILKPTKPVCLEVYTTRFIPRDSELYLDYTEEKLPLGYFQQQTTHYLREVPLDWEERLAGEA
ncbi:SET domain-containing protein [Acidithiobacillus thiooxidans]|uniref:SET domain-containing protein n=1 Tax=Acidithiobacillus thiooxidans TaxID=930 RepID=UPI0004E131FB|nr:SET domain-containing protein [Acidithiobacillus thiooxidans]